MKTEIVVAIITLVGTVLTMVGTLIGVKIQNNRHYETITTLLEYRLKQLELKQDKHNQVIERVYAIEKAIEVLEERQKVANNRISDLEKEG